LVATFFGVLGVRFERDGGCVARHSSATLRNAASSGELLFVAPDERGPG
jgi:hypothetical protein